MLNRTRISAATISFPCLHNRVAATIVSLPQFAIAALAAAVLCAALGMAIIARGQSPTAAIDVSNRKQLFIGQQWFASSKNIALQMNPPVKAGVVLQPDRSWDSGYMGFCVSVAEDGGQCKMWYLTQAKGQGREYVLCYACSKAGVAWEKPNLGLFEYQGSNANNIVMKGIVETTVFLDPLAPEESRFKAVAMMHWPDPKTAGLYVHTSPDGIHWKMSDQRVFPVAADTANQAFYDTRLKKYVAYVRVWAPLRKIGRAEMDNILKPWPAKQLEKPYYIWGADKIPVASNELPITFGYDEQDPPDSDHYNPACVQYPWADNAYFLFPSPYRHFPEPPKSKYGNDGLTDIQMAASRDGIAWTRLAREPYVALGVHGDIDCGQLYMADGMIRRGGKFFQYYGGSRVPPGAPVSDSKIVPAEAICRLDQRLDGFLSVDAPMAGGEFTTPPLRFSGTKLALNINASAMGICRVELLDEKGNTLPGHRLADCDEIGGNHLEKTVSWKGNADLSSLRGQPVRLRFVMRSCKLFAFQFP
jgi:hypothetical protein